MLERYQPDEETRTKSCLKPQRQTPHTDTACEPVASNHERQFDNRLATVTMNDNPLRSRSGSLKSGRRSILYLAPWVDLGGSDKGTIDWFKHIDQRRWAPSIITTQPSSNRWLTKIEPYAEEMWVLSDLMAGSEFPEFILEFIATRNVKIVHIMNSRLGFDLLPDIACLPSKPVIVVQHHAEEADRSGYVRYVASRYGNLVDGFSVASKHLARGMLDYDIAQSRVHVITMAGQHEALYERLLSHRREREMVSDKGCQIAAKEMRVTQPMPLALPREPAPPQTVAVIVPCYQHGRFLPDAIRSLHQQTLQPARIIVVDDASEDPETRRVLDDLNHDPLVTVIRQTHNRGPSVARNRALAEVNESYVLPLDADDMLPPRALETMVTQLERAPEEIGFIYPNVQHFGNRNDYYAAPAYNLDVLLDNNYCAASTLFDGRIFARGIRYAEDIVYGHEDWELILQLAEHGIQGQPASGPTLLYRKRGFSRVNAAEYGSREFLKKIRELHATLYRDRRDEIKAQWAPALSLLLVDGCDGSNSIWPEPLPEWLRRQTCRDFEVLQTDCRQHELDGGRFVQHPDGAVAAVFEAVRAARGKFVVLLGASASEILRAITFIEQVIRLLMDHEKLDRLVLARVENRQTPRMAPLTRDDIANMVPCGLAWRRDLEQDYDSVELGVLETPLEDIVLQWQARSPLSWRAI